MACPTPNTPRRKAKAGAAGGLPTATATPRIAKPMNCTPHPWTRAMVPRCWARGPAMRDICDSERHDRRSRLQRREAEPELHVEGEHQVERNVGEGEEEDSEEAGDEAPVLQQVEMDEGQAPSPVLDPPLERPQQRQQCRPSGHDREQARRPTKVWAQQQRADKAEQCGQKNSGADYVEVCPRPPRH